MSAMRRSRDVHRGSTLLLSLIMVVLGLAMIARALAGGGGVLAVGVVFGLLFVAAGVGRIWVARR
ncbi:MAG: hypothetical protein QOH46_143 [Solirubrobacteraceae bacterium]|jgi:hypothetical protein|nr:hypothetical protein [Solirubrobacteraceae bacterium]